MFSTSEQGDMDMEAYGQNKIRAQARANILNSVGSGWIVDRVDGQYVVRHDGTPATQPDARPILCLVQKNAYRKEIQLKAA